MAYPLRLVEPSGDKDAADVWLRSYLRVQRKYDKRIEQHLVSARDDVNRAILALSHSDSTSASVRRAQLIGTRGVITRVLKALYDALKNEIKSGQEEASLVAMRSAIDWSEDVIESMDIEAGIKKALVEALETSATHQVQAMMTRILQTERPLSEQVWKSYSNNKARITRIVNTHIAKGSSAEDLAKEVRDLVNHRTPGGVAYAAKRLARSEMNNAFHAQNINAAQQFPWINEMDWHLSGSHPRSVNLNEKCEQYAHKKTFKIGSVPDKPHPNCLCYVVPKVPDVETLWTAVQNGEYDDWAKSMVA